MLREIPRGGTVGAGEVDLELTVAILGQTRAQSRRANTPDSHRAGTVRQTLQAGPIRADRGEFDALPAIGGERDRLAVGRPAGVGVETRALGQANEVGPSALAV